MDEIVAFAEAAQDVGELLVVDIMHARPLVGEEPLRDAAEEAEPNQNEQRPARKSEAAGTAVKQDAGKGWRRRGGWRGQWRSRLYVMSRRWWQQRGS